MKLIIAGSRSITHPFAVVNAIEHFIGSLEPTSITEIVHGGARGVDTLGQRYAELYNLPVRVFKPDWKGNFMAAGFVRNGEMAEYADQLLAVWDGKSKGTRSMIELMQDLHKPCYVYYFTSSKLCSA